MMYLNSMQYRYSVDTLYYIMYTFYAAIQLSHLVVVQ